jgi:hypothetical protein
MKAFANDLKQKDPDFSGSFQTSSFVRSIIAYAELILGNAFECFFNVTSTTGPGHFSAVFTKCW